MTDPGHFTTAQEQLIDHVAPTQATLPPVRQFGAYFVTVVGDFLRADGTPVTDGRVVFRPELPRNRNNVCASVEPVIARLDDKGHFSAQVWRSDDMYITEGQFTFKYTVDVFVGAERNRYRLFVLPPNEKHQGAYDLSDLIVRWGDTKKGGALRPCPCGCEDALSP